MAGKSAKAKPTSGMESRRFTARKVQNAQYSKKRAELQAVAANLFKEKGFRNVVLDDIAKAAGLNRATLYYYISSKDDLFFDIAIEAMNIFVDKVTAIRNSEMASVEKIAEFIVTMMKHYEENYPNQYVFIQEVLPDSERQPERYDELVRLSAKVDEVILELINAAIADGGLRDDLSPRLFANAILGMINWSHRWFRPDGSLSGEQIGRQFAEMVLRGAVR